jgi:hypothetical protein
MSARAREVEGARREIHNASCVLVATFFCHAPDKRRTAKACMLFKSFLRGLCHAQWRKKHGYSVCHRERQMFCLL